MADNTSSDNITKELEIWRKTHAQLSNAVALASKAVEQEKSKRRVLLEAICANITTDGKLAPSSTWDNARAYQEMMRPSTSKNIPNNSSNKYGNINVRKTDTETKTKAKPKLKIVADKGKQEGTTKLKIAVKNNGGIRKKKKVEDNLISSVSRISNELTRTAVVKHVERGDKKQQTVNIAPSFLRNKTDNISKSPINHQQQQQNVHKDQQQILLHQQRNQLNKHQKHVQSPHQPQIKQQQQHIQQQQQQQKLHIQNQQIKQQQQQHQRQQALQQQRARQLELDQQNSQQQLQQQQQLPRQNIHNNNNAILLDSRTQHHHVQQQHPQPPSQKSQHFNHLEQQQHMSLNQRRLLEQQMEQQLKLQRQQQHQTLQQNKHQQLQQQQQFQQQMNVGWGQDGHLKQGDNLMNSGFDNRSLGNHGMVDAAMLQQSLLQQQQQQQQHQMLLQRQQQLQLAYMTQQNMTVGQQQHPQFAAPPSVLQKPQNKGNANKNAAFRSCLDGNQDKMSND